MDQHIAVGVTHYRAQASNIYNKVKAMFNENQLKLPSNTNNEIRDENKKKGIIYPCDGGSQSLCR